MDITKDTAQYKLLVSGKSAHGGSLTWSLPTQDGNDYTPGDWHTVTGDVVVCSNGLHLTSDPTQWLKSGCEVYLAEGRGDHQTQDDKTAFAEARLLRPAPEMIPEWWRQHERFVAELPHIPWCQPDGNPKPEWKLFTAPTLGAAYGAAYSAAYSAAYGAAYDAARGAAYDAARGAAYDAAYDAARGAAYDAARGAAYDAALYTSVQHICGDLVIEQRHRDHVEARWEVWRKGYCLLCDVDGTFYVYAKEAQS